MPLPMEYPNPIYIYNIFVRKMDKCEGNVESIELLVMDIY